MLIITNHQGNANQNEISPQTCKDECYQNKRQVLVRMWRKRYTCTPCTLLVEMQNTAVTMKNNMKILQKINNRTMFQQSHLYALIQNY